MSNINSSGSVPRFNLSFIATGRKIFDFIRYPVSVLATVYGNLYIHTTSKLLVTGTSMLYEILVLIGIHATDHHGTEKTCKDKNENVFLLNQLCVILPSFYLTIFCI